MFWSVQPGIKRGDHKAVSAGVQVLSLKAKVIGYQAPTKIELLGNRSAPITIETVREIINRVEEEDERKEN